MTTLTMPTRVPIEANEFEHPDTDSHAKIEAYEIIAPRRTSKKVPTSKTEVIEPIDDEPLIDRTAKLVLHSKKTNRLKKKEDRKTKRSLNRPHPTSILDLPPELLSEIFSWLHPTDLLRTRRTNRAINDFIRQHETSLTRDIISKRYANLARSFYLPELLLSVPSPATRRALRSAAWQEKLNIHTRPYQHIPAPDPSLACSCMACVLAWNNLCLVLDLAHFAPRLSGRDPLPIIERGTEPEWNTTLCKAHAAIVQRAMLEGVGLTYAAILQVHLATTVEACTRPVQIGKRKTKPNPTPKYAITRQDVMADTDAFLARKGPPSYEFPFSRDRYHYIEAYVPNRKWSSDEQRWLYAAPGQPHASDVAWVAARFVQPGDV